MLPTRFVPGQAPRKSRLGERQSFLPRRLGSTDRLSERPSGARSSSADTARPSVRLSREASVTKVPLNRRSRSGPGQSTVTPLRNSQYPRPTTTPVRTPSGDRSRGWEACLERALACVTVRDQRPIANTAWQRATLARVQEALATRENSGAALIRPLTIARFVDIAGALLQAITGDAKLNNDNYVAKLPNTCKRLLYPGTVSKSWLKTVNTLHAFPQALALIAYLLDLLQRIKSPVSDDWLYLESDERSRLRREYLRECFIRFQTPDAEYEDLTREYLLRLKRHLGTDEDKLRDLKEIITQHEQALAEELESSEAARASQQTRSARRDALLAAARAARHHAAAARAQLDAAGAAKRDKAGELTAIDADIARATSEQAQLRRELEAQSMSVEERARLLDSVDYATRVHDSKRVLADQIAAMVQSKETELARWQKATLDSCVRHKQLLIHLALAAQLPQLPALAVDETKLMEPSCVPEAGAALESVRQLGARVALRRAGLARRRTRRARERQDKLEEAQAAILELKSQIQASIEARDSEVSLDAAEEAAATASEAAALAKLREYGERREEHRKLTDELDYWRRQDQLWRAKLSEMREYIREQKDSLPAALRAACRERADIVARHLRELQMGSNQQVQ